MTCNKTTKHKIINAVLEHTIMVRMPQKESETPEYRLLVKDNDAVIKIITKLLKG